MILSLNQILQVLEEERRTDSQAIKDGIDVATEALKRRAIEQGVTKKPLVIMYNSAKALVLFCDDELFNFLSQLIANSAEAGSLEDVNMLTLFRIYKKVKSLLQEGNFQLGD